MLVRHKGKMSTQEKRGHQTIEIYKTLLEANPDDPPDVTMASLLNDLLHYADMPIARETVGPGCTMRHRLLGRVDFALALERAREMHTEDVEANRMRTRKKPK